MSLFGDKLNLPVPHLASGFCGDPQREGVRGITVLGGTTVPAPMMEPLPTVEPSKTMAPIPTRASSPLVAP